MDRKLLGYLPEVLQDVRELRAVMDTEQEELARAWDAGTQALDDQFVETAAQSGVSRWERILDITPKAGDSLQDRRFRILARLNEQLPFTLPMLRQQLESLCGADGYWITLDGNAYRLKVQVALKAKSNFQDVEQLLRRVAPANLEVQYTLKYNQHETLAGSTHRQLSAHTHHEIREEVVF